MLLVIFMLAVAFLLLSVTRLNTAYFVFIFMLPFVPRYIAIAVGTGMALSLKRLMVYSLLVGIFISVTMGAKNWQRVMHVISLWKGAVALILFVFLIKFIATIAEGGASNIIYWADDFSVLVAVLVLTLKVVNSRRRLVQLFATILLSLFFTELLSIIEFVLQRPLLQGYEVDVARGRDVLTSGIFRDEKYRVMALFENPLLLNQFVITVLPLIFCLSILERRIGLRVAVAALFGIITVYMTGSRAGLVIVMLAGLLYALISLFRRLAKKQKKIVTFGLLTLIFSGASFFIFAIANPAFFLQMMEFESGVSSVSARLLQYAVVTQLVAEKPLLGYGMMQNFNQIESLDGLDSYILRLALEGGLTVIITYIFFVIHLLIISYRQVASPKASLLERKIMMFLFIALTSFFISGLFVSMPNNLAFQYLIVGLILIIHPKVGILEIDLRSVSINRNTYGPQSNS